MAQQQHAGGGGYKVEPGVTATAADHEAVSSRRFTLGALSDPNFPWTVRMGQVKRRSTAASPGDDRSSLGLPGLRSLPEKREGGSVEGANGSRVGSRWLVGSFHPETQLSCIGS